MNFIWGKEDKMLGGVAKKKLRGGMQERGKEDKMRGGELPKNLRGRYAGEGKEDKMQRGGGGCEKSLRGAVCRRG